MQLLGEIYQREEEEEEGKGRDRIVPGLVSSRKQLLEAAIKEEKVTRKLSFRSSLGLEDNEEERKSVKGELVVDRKEECEKPRVRSFVGLRNATNSRANDFSAISGLPQLDRLSLQLPTTSTSKLLPSSSKEASPSLSEVSEASSELTSVSLNLEQLPVAPIIPTTVMSTSTTSSSNLSQVPEGGKKTSSPDQADFLIDDDYNDQQELTFYGHEEDSLEESLFEKVDSLLSRRQESQEAEDKDEVDGKDEGVGEIVDVNVDFSPAHHKPESDIQPIHLPKIDELKASEGLMLVRPRRASVDTLASQASITRDEEEAEDNIDDCMLDFDFEER